jgi:Ras GTPase-activating protein 3
MDFLLFFLSDNREVRYSVISGFIFLRFFAPAILGPRLFDLTTEHIVSIYHSFGVELA